MFCLLYYKEYTDECNRCICEHLKNKFGFVCHTLHKLFLLENTFYICMNINIGAIENIRHLLLLEWL